MFCKNCGQSLKENADFCSACGQETEKTGQPDQQSAVSQNQYNAQNMYPTAENQQINMPKLKKKHGCLTALIIVLVILAVIAAAVYFLVPGLLRPYDLDVESSTDGYNSALSKLHMIKDTAPETGDAGDYIIVYGVPQSISASLTSNEITSFLSENRPDYYAIKDVQVRINDDGTIEASAQLDTSYVFNEILNGEYTKEDAKAVMPMLGLIPDKINFYFDISGSVQNNQVAGLIINEVSVMGITIPSSLIDTPSADYFIKNTLDDYMTRMTAKSGAFFDSITANNGELDIRGNMPSSIERVTAG